MPRRERGRLELGRAKPLAQIRELGTPLVERVDPLLADRASSAGPTSSQSTYGVVSLVPSRA